MVVGDGFRAEQVAGSERSNPGRQNCFTLNQLPSSLFLFPVMDLLSYNCHKRTCSILGHFLLNG